jgi:hypothetical protein
VLRSRSQEGAYQFLTKDGRDGRHSLVQVVAMDRFGVGIQGQLDPSSYHSLQRS